MVIYQKVEAIMIRMRTPLRTSNLKEKTSRMLGIVMRRDSVICFCDWVILAKELRELTTEQEEADEEEA